MNSGLMKALWQVQALNVLEVTLVQ